MKHLLHNNHAELGGGAAMISIVIATLVAIIIGVMIWYKLNYAIFSASRVGANAAINLSYAGVNTTANTIWTLFPIVCIVLIAGVILAIVTNFGRGQA